jgi:hypothetical protein
VISLRGPETRSLPVWLVVNAALLVLACGIAVAGIKMLAGVVGGGSQDFGPPLILSGAQLSIHTTGTALPGGGWNLKPPGCVGEYLDCPGGGEYRISVLANGTPAGGVRPMIRALVDNRPEGSKRSVWGEWNAYSWTLQLGAGVHKITVRYDNLAAHAGKVRLLVAQFLARAENGRARPRVTTRAAWQALSGPAGSAEEPGLVPPLIVAAGVGAWRLPSDAREVAGGVRARGGA